MLKESKNYEDSNLKFVNKYKALVEVGVLKYSLTRTQWFTQSCSNDQLATNAPFRFTLKRASSSKTLSETRGKPWYKSTERGNQIQRGEISRVVEKYTFLPPPKSRIDPRGIFLETLLTETLAMTAP